MQITFPYTLFEHFSEYIFVLQYTFFFKFIYSYRTTYIYYCRMLCLNMSEILKLTWYGVRVNLPSVFSGVRVTRALALYVCFVDRFLSFCPFSFDHCVVCSSIYGFWLHVWYLQTILCYCRMLCLYVGETTILTWYGVRVSPVSLCDKLVPTFCIEITSSPPLEVPILILYVTSKCGWTNPDQRLAILVLSAWKSMSSMSCTYKKYMLENTEVAIEKWRIQRDYE